MEREKAGVFRLYIAYDLYTQRERRLVSLDYTFHDFCRERERW